MIVTDDQAALSAWLRKKTGLHPSKYLVCIGNTNSNDEIVGVVGYDGFNGASIQMHSAGEGNWLTRQLLMCAFDYPFNVCKVSMVLGVTPSGNAQALKFNEHVGFKTLFILDGAHPDGALVFTAMRREECRFLRSTPYGQQIK